MKKVFSVEYSENSMTRQILTDTCIFTFVLIFCAVLIYSTNEYDKNTRDSMNNLQTCITKTAHAEGYKGNVHGPEAWKLFGDNCVK